MKYAFVFLATIMFQTWAWAQEEVPGVVMGHSPEATNIYLGSPSIAIMDDGTYIASYQTFGKKLRESGEPEATIIALARTAYPEPDGTKAHSCHDANYITFHRISAFRENFNFIPPWDKN